MILLSFIIVILVFDIIVLAGISAQIQYNTMSNAEYNDDGRYHLMRYGGIICGDTASIVWSGITGNIWGDIV
jgi:hypothetical protein